MDPDHRKDEGNPGHARVLRLFRAFEHVVIYIITASIAILIAVSVWNLVLATISLFSARLGSVEDSEIFQPVFAMVLTVLIAFEFKNSLLLAVESHSAVSELRSVLLIAMLALVRKFIVIDVHSVSPPLLAALAWAVLALGIVFRMVRHHQDEHGI